MSHIVKINEYLDERIKFHINKMQSLQSEYINSDDSVRDREIKKLSEISSAIIDELNEVVKRVNGV